jgi:autotransporter-associated beta strand protein
MENLFILARMRRLILSALATIFAIPLHAAPPDLTALGVIKAIENVPGYSYPPYNRTYNLGATGLRGWIHLNNDRGDDTGTYGFMTETSRQILVTTAEAPGNANLTKHDIILGVTATSGIAVPVFTSDCRKAMGVAIGEAERKNPAILRVKRWRDGVTSDVEILMDSLGSYSQTTPFSCPKSDAIITKARGYLVNQLLSGQDVLSFNYHGAVSGLALLAAVKPGDPYYSEVQTKLKDYARQIVTRGLIKDAYYMWGWAYMTLYLSEYYLRSVEDGVPDGVVLQGIKTSVALLMNGQGSHGTFGHGDTRQQPDGSPNGPTPPYGSMNSVGIPANIALLLGKKAMIAGSLAIDPSLDQAIDRGAKFLAYYMNKGSLPYGAHEPWVTGHSSNGKDAMSAVFFSLQPNRTQETEYFTRMAVAGYTGREYGHSGQEFSYLWNTLGVNMGGELATTRYMQNIQWQLDLARRTDGSFVYWGSEQYGAGQAYQGNYLGLTTDKNNSSNINPTASYLLTYGVSLKRIYLTGKNASAANTLSAAKVENAIKAATYKQDCVNYSLPQLMAALSDFDPIVRQEAARQLGTRADRGTQEAALLSMLSTGTTNERIGACQALARLNAPKPPSALPLLSQRLYDSDPWVRALAARALASYGTDGTSQTTAMMTALVANEMDPEVIVWEDPVQIANGFLLTALVGAGFEDEMFNAQKSLFYPAVRVGLRHPDSLVRQTASIFTANMDKFLLTDVQMMAPDLVAVAATTATANPMWHSYARESGINVLTRWKAAEAMPVALAMQYHEPHCGYDAYNHFNAGLASLASFGDSARWALPGLRSLLATKSQYDYSYNETVNAITSIENANTSPAGIIKLYAVANSQLVTTSGPVAITITGSSCRLTPVTLEVLTTPRHGRLTGTLPNFVYTPNPGYLGPDHFTFKATDSITTSEPATVSIIVGNPGNGLKAEYFDNKDCTNLKLTRVDEQINFDWAENSPASGVGADTFSVRWTGKLLVPETAKYTFSTLSSDGVRLFVNGTLVMDKFTDRDTLWNDSVSINLIAGQKVDLRMDYYDNIGAAVAKLKWTGPSFAGRNGAFITKSWLYDEQGPTNLLPLANTINLSTLRNTSQTVTLFGSAPSQSALTYTIITQPSHGTLTGTVPNLTYSPTNGYVGVDSFTYAVGQGTGNSTPGTVSIQILSQQPEAYFWHDPVSGNWSGSHLNVFNQVVRNWRDVSRVQGPPPSSGDSSLILNFNPSGSYTTIHDFDMGFAFNQLNFASNAEIMGTKSLAPVAYGSLLPQIRQNSSSRVTIGTPLDLGVMTTLSGPGSGQVSLTGVIAGAGGIIVEGSHKLFIPGLPTTPANTYTGGTIVNSGILHLGSYFDGISSPCIDPLGSGPITLNDGGTIEFDRVTLGNALTINGGTLLSPNGWGASLSGAIALNGDLTISATGGLRLTGDVGGSGRLTKVNAGVLSLTGANSFTGTTLVKGGILQCSAQALGTGPLEIDSGGKVNLNFTGEQRIYSLSLNGGSTMAPGTYGSSASPAAYPNDTYFSGTGMVTVQSPGMAGLPVSNGLVLRMDASQISGVANGSQLNVWTDASGNSNNAVRQSDSSSGYPQYISNGINSRPVVRFNSGNPTMGDSLKFSRISTIRSVFWVLKENPGLSDTHFLLGDSSSYDFHRGYSPNGNLWSDLNTSSNIKTGTTRLMGNTINGVTTPLPSSSFQLVSLVTTGNVVAESICQDRVYHGSWQGDIAEILIYDRALTATEEAQVGSYLATKYGLTTNYPSAGALSAPTGIAAVADSAGAIRVSWAAVTNAVSYRVGVRNTQTGVEQTVTSTVSPCIVAGLNAGTSYEFKVSAGDANGNFGSPSSLVTATPRSAFEMWASSAGSGLTAGSNSGPLDDPDRDGVSNLLEFALGGAPMVHSRTILPALSKVGGAWFLEYSRSDLAEATTQAVEYSSDLKLWIPIEVSPNPASGVVITAGSPSDRIKVAIPAVSGKPTFTRLKVSQ